MQTDKKNENAKKPIHETEWPHIEHDKFGDKQHENNPIVKNLNATLNKISGKVDVKVSAIKHFIDKSVANINKTTNKVHQQIDSESSWLIDRINKKLKSIEKNLQRLKFGTAMRMNDEDFEEDDDESIARSIAHIPLQTPNIVHSEISKKLRSMELLNMDAELRGNLKTSISEAVRSAQEKFNKLIDDQITKINEKITDVTLKFEGAFSKFQETIEKIQKPVADKIFTRPHPTFEPVTSIDLKPKPTTSYLNTYTTPDYFKYTIPNVKHKQEDFVSSKTVDTNRMYANVVVLKLVDDAKSELTKIGDDSEKIVDAKNIDNKASMNDFTEKDLKHNDEVEIVVDTAKSLDDLQSEVLANVKDALKPEVEDLEAIENNQSEVLENSEDKLKSDTAESNMEAALAEEQSNEVGEDTLLASSDTDSSEAKNSDYLEEKWDETEEESETTAQSVSDTMKMLETGEDDDDGIDVDGNAMRPVEIPIDDSHVDNEGKE